METSEFLGKLKSRYLWLNIAAMAIVVVVKHWENLKRLFSGTESKFSFKKSEKAATTENESGAK